MAKCLPMMSPMPFMKFFPSGSSRLLRLMVPLLLVALIGGAALAQPAWAKPVRAGKSTLPAGLHVSGVAEDSPDIASILQVIQDLAEASNRHDLEGVLKHYSPRFVSGDSLSLQDVQHLIRETWDVYPDIRYESRPLEIRVNGDWATVESLDGARATAKPQKGVIDAPGLLESRSRGMIFLRRIGKTWEILSDYTLYETATILYGDARTMKIGISAPDIVFAGEPYTAKVAVDMPAGSVALASITKEPLVYPQREPQDKFRSLSDRQSQLERVFEANGSNNNEIVTATVGLTQIGHDAEDRPTITFNGIATVVKRVNVLPKSKFAEVQQREALVKRSASGVIDLAQPEKKPVESSAGEPAPAAAAPVNADPAPSPEAPGKTPGEPPAQPSGSPE